jgi:lipopolysaccharide transport system permease protein
MGAGLVSARSLGWRLGLRDISAQYRQTMLGYVWSVVPVLATTLVWVILNGSQIIQVDTGNLPYVVFALTGTVFWQLFFDALNAPLKQLGVNRAMLNRVNFAPEALLVSGGIQVCFSFAVKLVVLAAGFAIFGVSPHWTAVGILIPAASLVVFGMAIGMFLAPIGLLYRDIEQALPVVVGPLMLLTPVVYTEPSVGFLRQLMRVNPLTPLLNTVRAMLFGGHSPVLPFALVSAASLAAAFLGWALYRLAMPILIERIEA